MHKILGRCYSYHKKEEIKIEKLKLEDIDVEYLEGEEWKLYEGEYHELVGLLAVSNKGRLFKKGTETTKNQTRLLTGTLSAHGYRRLHVSVNSVDTNRAVHRLVAEMFCANPDNLPYVDHIDAVRDNNESSNLRWVTHAQNCRNEHYSKKLGERSSRLLKEHNYLQEGNKVTCYAENDKGEKLHFDNLTDLSKHFGRNKVVARSNRNTGVPIKSGALKGWKVYSDK